jgi:TRAP-type uncharacterized transport system substrate-binding protein
MKKPLLKLIFIASLGLLVISSLSFNCMAQPGKVELRWASAPTGASLYPLATAMVEDLKKAIPEIAPTSSNIPTSGPLGNVILISEGKKANIGNAFSDFVGRAWIGKEPYKKQIGNIRNLITLYRHVFQWVVWADSDIKKIEDLKNKRVSPFLKGLSAEYMARSLSEYLSTP